MATGDSMPEILKKSGDRVSISANKSWFGDMGLGQVTPFWDWGLFKKKTPKLKLTKVLGLTLYVYIIYICTSLCLSVSLSLNGSSGLQVQIF